MLTRRGLLQAAFGSGAAIAAERLLADAPAHAQQPAASANIVPFYGRHQAGITTTPPTCLALAAFDLATSSQDDVRLVLRSWTESAARMTEGKPASGASPGVASPPPDSGEAVGAGPQHLTITFGFGPGLFTTLGMPQRRPAGLQALPAMPGDQLDPSLSDGDIVVQACADSELVATHAIRQLIRSSAPLLVPRWLQTGFGIAARAPQVASTPRNLFGFKDGTGNPAPGSAALRDAVWIAAPDQPRWARGGTFMAVRRIRSDLSEWDADSLREQQTAFGRVKGSGAPLSGGTEYTRPDFSATRNGRPMIPRHAHIRVARPHAGEAPMLRRGCNFDDGLTADGQLDAGQIFVAFVRDLQSQFVPSLTRVMKDDVLTKHYTTHVGSAVFVIPPGAREGEYVGQTLFG